MNQKTKIVISIILVAVVVLLGAYFFKKRQARNQIQNATPATVSVTNENQPTQFEAENQALQNEINAQLSRSTKEVSVVSGTITKLSDKDFEIKNLRSQITLPFNEATVITAIKNGASQPRTIADVKMGDLVSVSINNTDISVKAVEIEEVK